MRQFLRNLVLWIKLLAMLVLLVVVASFGIWGWGWFTILFCLCGINILNCKLTAVRIFGIGFLPGFRQGSPGCRCLIVFPLRMIGAFHRRPFSVTLIFCVIRTKGELLSLA